MEFNYDIMKKFIESADWNSDKTCFMFKKMYQDYKLQIDTVKQKNEEVLDLNKDALKEMTKIMEINESYKIRIKNMKGKELKFRSKIETLIDLEKVLGCEIFCVKMLEYYREYYSEFEISKEVSEKFRVFLKENDVLDDHFKTEFLKMLNQYIF
jgi:hypothetical protein